MTKIFNAADRSGAHPAPQPKCVRRQWEREIAERAQAPFVRLRRTQGKGEFVPPGPSHQPRACPSARRDSARNFRQTKCHTMPSNFRPISLKTNDRHPHKVSHFFKTGLPLSTPERAPEAAVSGAREIKRAWEIRPLGSPIARLALLAADTKATAGAASGAPTKATAAALKTAALHLDLGKGKGARLTRSTPPLAEPQCKKAAATKATAGAASGAPTEATARTDKSVCATKAKAYTALTASGFLPVASPADYSTE